MCLREPKVASAPTRVFVTRSRETRAASPERVIRAAFLEECFLIPRLENSCQ